MKARHDLETRWARRGWAASTEVDHAGRGGGNPGVCFGLAVFETPLRISNGDNVQGSDPSLSFGREIQAGDESWSHQHSDATGSLAME